MGERAGTSSTTFAGVVRILGAEVRALGLEVPGFRSPPRIPADRSLRRRPGATPAVAVRLAGRPLDAVVTDMVEGVIVANQLAGRRAIEVRSHLLATMAAGPLGAAA
jgi:hypothetical protein